MKTRRLSHDRLLQLRLRSGKSQGDVAYELRQRGFKVDATSISRWERGEHEPRANVMPALAAVFDVSIDEMYADDEDDEGSDPMRRAAEGLVSALTDEMRRAIDRSDRPTEVQP